MRQYADGTAFLTRAEYLSLAKLVSACNEAISSLSNDGNFLGWDNYRALGMWDDTFNNGNDTLRLDDYVGEEEKREATTVEEWLAAYGERKRNV